MKQDPFFPEYGFKKGLSSEDILTILLKGHRAAKASDLPPLSKQLAVEYGRCEAVIRNIWYGRSYAFRHPEIERMQRRGHGRSKLTDEQVLRVRLTWQLHSEIPGLKTALARWAGVATPAMIAILEGKHRKTPKAKQAPPIPLSELEFKRCPGKGELSGFSKLKGEQVLQIIELWNQGRKKNSIAKLFGVGACLVGDIINRKSWKHLTKDLVTRTNPRKTGYKLKKAGQPPESPTQ